MGDNDQKEHEEFEEEFDFDTEKEGIDDPESSSEQDMDDFSSKARSKLPLIIGVVVVGFLGWQAISFFSSDDPEENVQGPSLAQSTTSSDPDASSGAALQDSNSGEPSAMDPSLTSERVGSDPTPLTDAQGEWSEAEEIIFGDVAPKKPRVTLDALMKRIEKGEKDQAQKIAQLESTVGEMAMALKNMGKGVSQTSQNVSVVAEMIRGFQKDIKGLKSDLHTQIKATEMAKKKKMQGHTQPEIFTSPKMVVHAIIPGRAWIKTQDGHVMTITEGDNLDTYGKVLVIDASTGVVITSSGVTLR